MANGRTNNRRNRNYEARSSVERQSARRQDMGGFFGDGPDIESPGYYPRTNDALIRTHEALKDTFRDQLGLTADQFSVEREAIAVTVDRQGEPFRQDEKVPASELPSRETASNQAATLNREAGKTELNGQFPVDFATALIIGNRAIAFRRAEHQTSATKGESGPIGPAQELPGLGMTSEATEEHFIIAKKRGEEVIVAVQTGENEHQQTRRVFSAKRRILQTLEVELRQLMQNYHLNRSAIEAINQKVGYLTKPRPIVFVKPTDLPAEIENSMQTVKMSVNGTDESLRGYIHFDQAEKNLTIARPVRLDLETAGIDPDSPTFFDGSGLNREIRYVDGDEKTLSPLMRRMLYDLHRPRPIQRADKSLVPFAPLEWHLYRNPSVVPQF